MHADLKDLYSPVILKAGIAGRDFPAFNCNYNIPIEV